MRYGLIPILVLVPTVLAAQDRPGLYLEGSARMGIVWDRPAAAPGSDRAEARLYARSQLRMRAVGQTDGGLSYGIELDLDKLGAGTGGQHLRIGN